MIKDLCLALGSLIFQLHKWDLAPHQQQPFSSTKHWSNRRAPCWCRRTIKNQSGNGLCVELKCIDAAAVRLIQLVLIKERPSPRARHFDVSHCAPGMEFDAVRALTGAASLSRIHSVWIIINHFVIYYYFDAISSRQKIAHKTLQN